MPQPDGSTAKPLTDITVRQARPKEKEYKLSNERGLLLVVRPTAATWWRLRDRFQGREKMISLGIYPDVSLSIARDRRDASRRLVADGKDPSAERQADKKAQELTAQNTFEKVARSYLAGLAKKVHEGKAAIKTYTKAKWMLETFIFPRLGNRPITGVEFPGFSGHAYNDRKAIARVGKCPDQRNLGRSDGRTSSSKRTGVNTTLGRCAACFAWHRAATTLGCRSLCRTERNRTRDCCA